MEMNRHRMGLGSTCLLVVLIVGSVVWAPPVHGNQIRFRSVSRARGTFHTMPVGVVYHGYFTAPVTVQPSVVVQTATVNNSGIAPSSTTRTIRPIKIQGITAQGETVEFTLPPGIDLGSGATTDSPSTPIPDTPKDDAGSPDGSKDCESDKKAEKGLSAADAEKCRKDRDALTEELKQLKASMAAEKLSKELGNAEADLTQATAVHKSASDALNGFVMQTTRLETDLQSLVTTFQNDTAAYDAMLDKDSEDAKKAAKKVADGSVLLRTKEHELANHSSHHESIKSKASEAAAAFHAAQLRFKMLSKQGYGE
jgi:hypothetical protein